MIFNRRILGTSCLALLLVNSVPSFAGDIADAAEKGNIALVRQLLDERADVNEPQIDGATALHWAVHRDDIELVQLLLDADADPSVKNRLSAPPMQLAAENGNAAIISALLEAGADPNEAVTSAGVTALMLAARTGIADAVAALLERGADVNAMEPWGQTTALMWAVNENHVEAASALIEHGADINAKSIYIPPETGRGFEGTTPRERREDEVGPIIYASGELSPLLLASREGHLESARILVAAGADVNAIAADGKNALGLAIFNGHYELGSYLIDEGIDVNQADAQNFTPLFWAVDRRNMETAPNFPWVITDDPLPLIKKMLDTGADPNYLVDNTPMARMRGGSPRVVFSTALMRTAFSADVELFNLLLEYGADPLVISKDGESVLSAAAGAGWVHGFHKERPMADRLEIVRRLVELGCDVNWFDNYGITPLMAAANIGDIPIIQYLIDQGADLDTRDLGKKWTITAYGSSIEPLMPVDYAIGVGTYRPNNAIYINEEATQFMLGLMAERGIKHTTSECTLRGFTCAAADMDPRNASPETIARARALQTGYQVEQIERFSGLTVKGDKVR